MSGPVADGELPVSSPTPVDLGADEQDDRHGDGPLNKADGEGDGDSRDDYG